MPSKVVGTSVVALSSDSVPVDSYTVVQSHPNNTSGKLIGVGYNDSITINTGASTATMTTDVILLMPGQSYQVPKAKAASPSAIRVIADAASQVALFDKV